MGNFQGRNRSNSAPRTPQSPPNPPTMQILRRRLTESHKLDKRAIEAMILEKKLAPLATGVAIDSSNVEECPICFLNFDGLNHAKCCKGSICTDCFLQVVTSAGGNIQDSICPFCNGKSFFVVYEGSLRKSTDACLSTSKSPDQPDVKTTSLQTPSPDKSTTITVAVSSVESRKILEKQMQTQREYDGKRDLTRDRPYGSAPVSARQARRSQYGLDETRTRHGRQNTSSDRGDGSSRPANGSRRFLNSNRNAVNEQQTNNSPIARMRALQMARGEGENSDDDDDVERDLELFLGGGVNRIRQQRGLEQRGMDLAQIEEIMLMEAIRMSMAESSVASPPASTAGPPPSSRTTAPPPTRPTDGSKMFANIDEKKMPVTNELSEIDFDDDDAVLAYALSLSQITSGDMKANDTHTNANQKYDGADKDIDGGVATTSATSSKMSYCDEDMLESVDLNRKDLKVDFFPNNNITMCDNEKKNSYNQLEKSCEGFDRIDMDVQVKDMSISSSDMTMTSKESFTPLRLNSRNDETSKLSPAARRLMSMIDDALSVPQPVIGGGITGSSFVGDDNEKVSKTI